MAVVAAQLTTPSSSHFQADYPALFSAYVVRAADVLRSRLEAIASLTPEEFALTRDHALHILTFALGSDEAWSSARDLLLALAEPMEQAGARSEWLPFLHRGVERSTALADIGAEAELSLRIGHLLRLVSEFANAQQWLEHSLRCWEQLEELTGIARALNQLAYVDCLLNHNEHAVQRATTALTLLAEDDSERAMSRFVLGMVASNRWQWAEAETHHRAALALRQAQGNARRTAWALQNVGYALQGQQRYAEALEYFRAADVVLEELGDKANRAIVLMNLARTYHLDSQLALALETGLAARQLLHDVGDRLHAARHDSNLGLTYLALHDPQAALAAFQESINAYTLLDDTAGRVNTTSGLAMAHLALEEYAAAVAVLAPALEELAPLVNVPGIEALQTAMVESLASAQAALGQL